MKKLVILVLALAVTFSLVGCNQKLGPGRPITAYIGNSVTSVDITHHVGGETVQWIAQGEDVDSLRDWASKLEYEIIEFEDGQSPGDSDGGEVYDFVLTEGGYPGFSYVINGTEDCYLLIEGYWFSVKNPSDPPIMEPHKEQLSLAEVRQLAEKGEDLSWDDFEQYSYREIGSGLHIFRYDIDEKYCLVIGGRGTQTPPMYIRLVCKADDSEFIDDGVYIDIRTENVDDFINSNT